jgi:hypothetical protein
LELFVVAILSLSWELQVLHALSIMTVRGGLDGTSGFALLGAALRVLERGTPALIMDLSGLRVIERQAVAVFPMIVDRAARWPGTPVLSCVPRPEEQGLTALATGVAPAVFRGVDDARAALFAHAPPPAITEELLPVSGATRQARDLATEACLRWDLHDLVAPSALVAGELVGNAADHAATVVTLHLSLGWRDFYVAVSDGARTPPVPDRSPSTGAHGLDLVERHVREWGCVPLPDGKVVWAALARAVR